MTFIFKIRNCCYSSDGKLIISSDGGGNLLIWDVNTLSQIQKINDIKVIIVFFFQILFFLNIFEGSLLLFFIKWLSFCIFIW